MTVDYIHPSSGHFYPLKIPQQHNQLKNFISTKEPNIIYYASEHEIYGLQVSTRKRKLIKSLPWQPICLDAAYGWICVGGRENGQCAFIRINENSDAPTRAFGQHVEVDELLPLDLDPESRRTLSNPNAFLQWPRPSWGTSYELQTHELGTDVVNSITIHLLQGEKSVFRDEVVAVLANNDQSIRIFSLTQARLLETLEFPVAMNHASISPDGKLLLAVGNRHTAFFCRRIRPPNALSVGGSPYARYEWHEFAGLKLSVAESQDPWQSEDQGNVCVVDIRNAFQSRQTIDLHTDSPGFTRTEVEEYDNTSEQRQLEIERRFVERHREALEAQDQLAAVVRTANSVELAAERRRVERDAAASEASRERQLIDSIGQRRLQGSHSVSSGNNPFLPASVNYIPPSTRWTESHGWSGIPSPSSNPHNRSTASIHEFMRQRERHRLDDRSPHRRNSIVMSNSNLTETSSLSSSNLIPGLATTNLSASPSRLSAGTSDIVATSTPFNPADPWQTITDAMSTANIPPGTLRSLQSRNPGSREQATAIQPTAFDPAREQMAIEDADTVEAQRDRTRDNPRSLRQMRAAYSRADVLYDEIGRELLLRRYRRISGRMNGTSTMGIGWSEDGRNL
ncbi:hypothetical protein BDR22DRAFT_888194 [Usnea florida]